MSIVCAQLLSTRRQCERQQAQTKPRSKPLEDIALFIDVKKDRWYSHLEEEVAVDKPCGVSKTDKFQELGQLQVSIGDQPQLLGVYPCNMLAEPSSMSDHPGETLLAF